MRKMFVNLTVTLVLGILLVDGGGLGLESAAATSGTSAYREEHLSIRPPVEPAVVADPGTSRRPSTTETPLRVLLMGDSLSAEAGGDFESAISETGRAAVDRSLVFGGTAICDWIPQLEAKVDQFHPDVAVVEFSGNSLTSCMQDPATGAPYSGNARVEKYRRDAEVAMDVFTHHGVDVYWIGSPITRSASERPLTVVYATLPWTWSNAHYVDAGSALLDHGAYTDFLACVPKDPCTDVDPRTGRAAAKVRAPDGGHFCPVGPEAVRGVTGDCPVWSSGAYRFGTAMAAPVIEDYGLGGDPILAIN